MSLGNARFAEPSYFENELRHSRHFQSLTIWTASVMALGLFIIVRFYTRIPLYLLFMFGCAVGSVGVSWVDAIRDHKRIHAAIQTKSSDELARQALALAAGQAIALESSAFFFSVVLFVLAVLLVHLVGR